MIAVAVKFFKGVATFILDNWRWILPLLLALLLWRFIVGIQDERDGAIRALEQYQQDARDAAVLREIENRNKELAAGTAIEAVKADHTQELETIRRNYALLNQADKGAAAGSIDLWRERVRLELKRQADAGLPGVPEPTGTPPEVGGGGDAADPGQADREYISTLETACAITTSDYNALWDSWTAACQSIGCKDPVK